MRNSRPPFPIFAFAMLINLAWIVGVIAIVVHFIRKWW